MAGMSGVREFVSDLVEDLKRSWRFKLAIVLWIPLVVTTIVALVQFGAMNKAGDTNTFATVQLVAESTVNFPMFYIFRPDNQPYWSIHPISCTTNTGATVPVQKCQPSLVPNVALNYCQQVAANTVAATPANNQIICQIQTSATYNNSVFQLTVVGADGIPDDAVWINPHVDQSIAVQQVLTMQTESAQMDTSWSADIDYFNSVLSPTGFTLRLRIDDFNNILYTNSNTFTDYQFLAAWGGVMFFFYVLWAFVMFVAKLFLPADSKLMGGPAGASTGPSYQTIS